MSATKKIILTVVISVSVAASAASAQTSHGSGSSAAHGVHRGFHGLHHGHNSHYGGYGHHGYRYGYRGYVVPSTGLQFGMAARGAADLIRSRAQANLTNAHASSQREVARTQRLENDVFALQARLERKHINKTSRFGHLHARAAELAEMNLASTHAGGGVQGGVAEDKRLAADEVEPRTGKLAWPLLLAMSHFENARRPIDEVFAVRAEAGSLHPDDYLPLLDLIENVMADLQMNAVIFPKRDLADAQDFLRRMKAEARLPALASASGVQLVSHGN